MRIMSLHEALDRARTAFRIGDHELVERLLTRIIAERPDFHPAYNMLGIMHLRQGSHAKARTWLEQAIKVKQDYTEAHNNLGIVYREIGYYEEALAEFRRALALGLERADLHFNLGNVYKQLEEYPTALTEYRKAVSLDPTFTPAYNNLGTVLERMGRLDEAAAAYRQGLQTDPNQPRLHYNLGVILDRLGESEEARTEFEAAVRAQPGWIDALNNLGVVCQKLGRHAEAEKRLREVLRVDANSIQARNNLGVVYREMGRLDEATALFREAVRIDPAYTTAGFNLGGVLEESGFVSEALQEYERLARQNPKDAEARFRIGVALQSLDRVNEAIARFEEARRLRADHVPTLRALGAAYRAKGDAVHAAEAFGRLAQIDPTNADHHYDLALLYRDQEQLEAAEAETKEFLAQNPDHVGANLLLGDVYLRQKRFRHAAQVFAEVLERDPTNAAAHTMLATAARALGDPGQAIESIERLLTIQGTSDDAGSLRDMPATLDRYEEAVADYEQRYRSEWSRSLRALRERGLESTGLDEGAEPGPEAGIGLEGLEEEAVPIINIGGLEPTMAIEEDEEDLSLSAERASREAADQHGEDISDERPPSLMNLLHGQELYEENPAWKDFQGLPEAGAGGAGGPGARSPQQRPQQQPSPQPQYPPQSYPPQAYRPLPQQPRPAQPPPQSPPPAAPVQPYPEVTPYQPETAPEPAVEPARQEDTGQEDTENEDGREAGGDVKEAAEVALEESPEDIWEGEPPAEAPAAALEETDGAAQPAAAANAEEAQEPAESQEPERPEKPQEKPGEGAKASSDLRKELQDYLAKVKNKLDDDRRSEEREQEPDKLKAPALLDYLGKLANHLPNGVRSRFQESDERLRMEVLKSKLFGRRGLWKRAATVDPAGLKAGQVRLSPRKIADTFSYMKGLATYIRDGGLRRNMEMKLDTLLGKLRATRGEGLRAKGSRVAKSGAPGAEGPRNG